MTDISSSVTFQKFNVFDLDIEFITLVRKVFIKKSIFKLFSRVLGTPENIGNPCYREMNSIFNVKTL